MGRIRSAQYKFEACESRIIRPYSFFKDNYTVNSLGSKVGCQHARGHSSSFDENYDDHLVISRDLYKINDYYAEMILSRRSFSADGWKVKVNF